MDNTPLNVLRISGIIYYATLGCIEFICLCQNKDARFSCNMYVWYAVVFCCIARFMVIPLLMTNNGRPQPWYCNMYDDILNIVYPLSGIIIIITYISVLINNACLMTYKNEFAGLWSAARLETIATGILLAIYFATYSTHYQKIYLEIYLKI